MPVPEYLLKDLRNSTIFRLCGFPYIKTNKWECDGPYLVCLNMHGQEVCMHENTPVRIVAHLEDYYEPQPSNAPEAAIPFQVYLQ